MITVQDAATDPAPEDDRRNFSPYEMFLARARQHRPRYRFDPAAAAAPEAGTAEGHDPEGSVIGEVPSSPDATDTADTADTADAPDTGVTGDTAAGTGADAEAEATGADEAGADGAEAENATGAESSGITTGDSGITTSSGATGEVEARAAENASGGTAPTLSTPFAQWRERALPPVLETLGRAPERVEANPRLLGEWDRYGVLQQRWQVDLSPGFSATAVINRPASLRENERRPGILCWHGHTTPSWIGKEAMMGNDTDPDLQAHAADAGYGLAKAREGYVTFAIDWMGYGDSDDNNKPNHRTRPGEHVWCNVYYLQATMLGMTPLGINLAHGRALVDFVSGLGYVDPARIGVLGFSGGGVLALWSALTDPRLIAVEIACYSDLFADFGYRDGNYCGAQVAPGLYELVDVPDLQGLLAPTPLLVDVGAYDRCFRLDSAMACHRRVAEIYRAAGAAHRLHLNLFPGGHRWDATESGAFFAEYLAAAPG